MKQKELESNFELALVKELNSVKLSSEEHSSNMINQIDDILIALDSDKIDTNNVKNKLFKIIDDLQFQDINRQKIERVMNNLIEAGNISDEVLIKENLAKSPSAKHIDDSDGESISEAELAALIAANNE